MGQEIAQGVYYLRKCIMVLQSAEYLPPLIPLCQRLIKEGIDCRVMLSEELLRGEVLSSKQMHTKSGEMATIKEWEVTAPPGVLYLTDDPLVYAALADAEETGTGEAVEATGAKETAAEPLGAKAAAVESTGTNKAGVEPTGAKEAGTEEEAAVPPTASQEMQAVCSPPVLIYLHCGNQDADFGDAPYALEDPQEAAPEYLERVYRRFHNLPWEILVTERCWLRETVEEDVDSFWKMYQDPDITRYTEQLYPSPETERRYISEYRRLVYAFYEFGVWTVLDRQSGAVVGRAGLSVREGYNLPELGFVIGRKWQRRGLAGEVCRGILEYARELLGFEQIQALVHEENAVSLHLCRKLGFREQVSPAAAGKSHGKQMDPPCLVELEQNGRQERFVYMVCEGSGGYYTDER